MMKYRIRFMDSSMTDATVKCTGTQHKDGLIQFFRNTVLFWAISAKDVREMILEDESEL